MTQVDFYVLSDAEAKARNLWACKVADKAYRSGHRVFMLAANQQQVEELDRLLWTFSQNSFTPHETCQGSINNEQTPILIGDGEVPETWHDVLISLADEVPSFFSRFDRVVEIVPGDEEHKKNARDRFRFYRDRGYPLESHQI